MNAKHLFALGTLGLIAMAAQAEQSSGDAGAAERGFYLGGSLGYARGEVDAGDINQRMAVPA